uniref:Uncharacterized protein n=1 Tax=Oryza sativa subsp. japonica TaxID=39947 RepID=Q6ES47_ORYSJ|nr:hypothetical protein [Oryza sativa Japonica Group]
MGRSYIEVAGSDTPVTDATGVEHEIKRQLPDRVRRWRGEEGRRGATEEIHATTTSMAPVINEYDPHAGKAGLANSDDTGIVMAMDNVDGGKREGTGSAEIGGG